MKKILITVDTDFVLEGEPQRFSVQVGRTSSPNQIEYTKEFDTVQETLSALGLIPTIDLKKINHKLELGQAFTTKITPEAVSALIAI